MKKPIYLDYNATTPVDERVVAAMKPYFCENFGNPSSTSHSYGWDADMAVRKARKEVAELIGAQNKEVYFTSGASESNNLILQGVTRWHRLRKEPVHVMTTATEHKSVLDVVRLLESEGAEITILPVNKEGAVSADDVRAALRPETRLVSVIFANNEIGTINPVAEIGRLCRERDILFHTDAAQAAGKVPFKVEDIRADFVSGSAQKMYGPKGVGFAYIREAIRERVAPLMAGGSQERGLRPGTLNVPGIVGLGEACRIFRLEMTDEIARLTELRDHLIERLTKLSSRIRLNGSRHARLCNNINLTISGMNSDIFALGLNRLAVSSASACAAGAPSHVLKAIGLSDADARATLRIGIGRNTTPEQIEIVIQSVEKLLASNSANQLDQVNGSN